MKSKADRHKKIMEIIETQEVETQEELAAKLNQSGFSVTQATVSRDIRELNLSKVTDKNGKQHYAVLNSENGSKEDKPTRLLKDGIISVVTAQNLLVVKTATGMAMAVAAAIDALDLSEMAGCIAGDDVIVCVSWDNEKAEILKKKFEAMIGR